MQRLCGGGSLIGLKHVDKLSKAVGGIPPPLSDASRKLEGVRALLPAFFRAPVGWSFADIADGIMVTYDAAKVGMRKLARKQSSKRAHAWRKDAQRLLYQLGAIEGLCPEFLVQPLQALTELTDLLGEHHDLAILDASLDVRPAELPRKKIRAVAMALVARQDFLRRRALEAGDRLFARTPREFRDARLVACAGSVNFE